MRSAVQWGPMRPHRGGLGTNGASALDPPDREDTPEVATQEQEARISSLTYQMPFDVIPGKNAIICTIRQKWLINKLDLYPLGFVEQPFDYLPR